MSTTRKGYQKIITELLKNNNIKVLRYYRTVHGQAYLEERAIKIPKVTDELSFYIAAHEIGHIVAVDNGLSLHEPRWKHEYEATKYALDKAREYKIRFPKKVYEAIIGYLRYTIIIATRANTKIPQEVFSLAELDRDFWMTKISNGYRPKYYTDRMKEMSFMEWRNITIKWV